MDEKTQLSSNLMDDLFLDAIAKQYALCILTGREPDLTKRINVEISLFKRSMDAQKKGAIEPDIRPAMASTTIAEENA